MKNKGYYYIENDIQFGPLNFEELKFKNLLSETLVWTEGMHDWQMIKEIPELNTTVRLAPPPIPKKNAENITRTEISGELKVKTEKSPNKAIEKITPSNRALKMFLIWSGIHLFALITSYSEIDIFSEGPQTDEFWPFVEFVDEDKYFETESRNESNFTASGEWKTNYNFNGVFNGYDWSEFLVFVVGAYLIFVIGKLGEKNENIESS